MNTQKVPLLFWIVTWPAGPWPGESRKLPRIPASGLAEVKESDPTSLSLFIDLALLNRFVRSLPRNGHPTKPRAVKQEYRQTNRRGAQDQPLHGHVAAHPAPTSTQDKEIDIPFGGPTALLPSFGLGT